MTLSATQRLDTIITAAIARRVSPAIAAAVGTLDDHLPSYFCVRGATPNTLFDLASLTKVYSTTLIAAHAIALGKLSLEERPFPQWPQVSVLNLLQHTSSLPAWKNFYDGTINRQRLVDNVLSFPISHIVEPHTIYSDLGFIALGSLLESRLKARIDILFDDISPRYYGTSCMAYRSFGRPLTQNQPIAPTGFCSVRRRDLKGEVNDLNAFAMGGAAPHAGLFSNLSDAIRASRFILSSIKKPQTQISRILYNFANAQGERAAGFDRPSKGGSTGSALSPFAVGHLGFTGTSVWLDPLSANGRGAYFVLLTNHLDFSSRKAEIKQLRRDFHKAAARWVETL